MNNPYRGMMFNGYELTESDFKSFFDFWKLYSSDIGQKTVRKAKGNLKRTCASIKRKRYWDGLLQKKIYLYCDSKGTHDASIWDFRWERKTYQIVLCNEKWNWNQWSTQEIRWPTYYLWSALDNWGASQDHETIIQCKIKRKNLDTKNPINNWLNCKI